MADYSRQGKVRAIASTGLSRSANLPDMPTVAESGVPKYEATIWLGLMVEFLRPSLVGSPRQRGPARAIPVWQPELGWVVCAFRRGGRPP
jgi:hypothetical protein